MAALLLLLCVGLAAAYYASRGARPERRAAGVGLAASRQIDVELTQLRRAAQTSGIAEDLVALGDALAERGRWFEAIWAFQDALDREPAHFTARFSVASALVRARLPAEAIPEFEALLRDHPESETARIALARAHRSAGRPDAGLAVLKAPPAGEPSPDFLLELGRSAYAAGRPKEARDAFETCARRAPDRVEAHYWLGRLLLDQGDVRGAVAALRRARERDPKDADVAWALGMALRAAKAPVDEIGELLTEAVRLRPNHVEALKELAALYRENRRLEPAAQYLSRAIRAAPQEAEPHRQLSAVMAAMGRPDDAEYHRGLYFLTRDQPLKAIEVFRGMARRSPDKLEPVLMASLGFVKMKRNIPAVREVAAARSRFPREPELLERLAALYVLTHDQPLARQVCEQWRRIDPNDPRPAWVLGRIAAKDGQTEEAVALYEEALRLRPEFLDVKGDLARALLELSGQERLKRAREVLEEALERAPGLPELHLQLGLTLQALGELEPARERFLRALELDPRQVPAYHALITLAPRLGKPGRTVFYGRLLRAAQDRAREHDRRWVRLWEKPEDAARFREMARFFLDDGDLLRAGYHLDSALELRPNWSEARAERDLVRRLRHVQ